MRPKARKQAAHARRKQAHADKRKRTRKPYRAPEPIIPGLPYMLDTRSIGFLELLKRHPNTYRRAA